jgi:hypothetical protein
MKRDANDIHRKMGADALRKVIDHATDPAAARKQQQGEQAKPVQTNGKQLVVHDASAVPPEPIRWVWRGRIAIGKTTLVGGDPGLGKSQLSIFIASTISQGGQWPCQEGTAPKRSVIMFSVEDGIADTIVPRLMAAGADLGKVRVVTAVCKEDHTGRRIFNLTQDLDLLENLITKLGDVGLVIIDPVDAYIGGNVDTHKNAAVRAVLEPISEMADRLGVAILAITHFSKQAATKAIYRFIGSIAQVGAARFAFAVVADPFDKTRILLLQGKVNVTTPQKGLAFRIGQRLVADGVTGSFVTFELQHVTGITADEVLVADNGAEQSTAKDEVKKFLSDVLANGRQKVQDIEAEARHARLLGEDKQMRLSKPFRSAKTELRIDSTHEGFGPDAIYYWSLPEQVPDADAIMRAHHKERAHMENEGAHGDREGVEGAHGSLHARPQTPCAPSLYDGAHGDSGAHEGAHGGNGPDAADDDLTIPPFLDRRDEPDCAYCGLRGGSDCAYGDVTVRLHWHCERPWREAYDAGRRNGGTPSTGAQP